MKKIFQLVIIMNLFLTGFGTIAIPNSIKKINSNVLTSNEDTEYWALIVGCNEFINMPSATLPGNDIAAEDLYQTLLASDNWNKENIRLLTGKNASSINILRGLRWLDKMDDEDDICLFYIATHGGPGPDYFPKDEADGMDEWLTTYSTYEWYIPKLGGAIQLPYFHRISDDQINYMLSLLDAEGVCAIIDACFSGGFNETPYEGILNRPSWSNNKQYEITADEWMKDFSKEISASGRVVLMSTREDSITLTWCFVHYLMEGLQGFGNINEDSIVSAEEAFQYGAAQSTEWLLRKYGELYEPQILDDYPGELQLTDINFPPEQMNLIGLTEGTTNHDYSYTISSIDPEENHIRYYIDWGDDTSEWTDYFNSNESLNLHHSWKNHGTYNIWYNNEDEYGVVNSFGPIFDFKVISITDENKVDQKQTLFFDGADVNDGIFSNKIWLAQSFVPQYTTLSKVALEISTSSYYVGPLTLSIRNNLTGEDLATVTVLPNVIDNWFTERLKWTTFDVPDLDVIPGDSYYLIIHCDQTDSLGAWMHVNSDCDFHPDYEEDPYTDGNAFLSKNYGRNWIENSKVNDFCFVTYGS